MNLYYLKLLNNSRNHNFRTPALYKFDVLSSLISVSVLFQKYIPDLFSRVSDYSEAFDIRKV